MTVNFVDNSVIRTKEICTTKYDNMSNENRRLERRK